MRPLNLLWLDGPEQIARIKGTITGLHDVEFKLFESYYTMGGG